MRKAQSERSSDAHEAEQEQEGGSEGARERGWCLPCVSFALPACLHAPAARKGGRASGCLACRRRRKTPTNERTPPFRSLASVRSPTSPHRPWASVLVDVVIKSQYLNKGQEEESIG